MSYAITVTVKDGEITGTTSSGPLEDGQYAINGHVPTEGTWQAEQIQVSRSLPGSVGPVIQASATHFK